MTYQELPEPQKQNIRSRVFYVISLMVVSLVILIGIVTIYWNAVEYDPFVLKNTTKQGYIKVLNKEKIYNGQFVKLAVEYDKTTNGECEFKAFIVGRTRPELVLQTNVERGHKRHVKADLILQLPEFNTYEDRYIEFLITCRVNPIRNVEDYMRSETFSIKELP